MPERIAAQAPKFFKRLTTVLASIGGVGAVVVALPLASIEVTVGGYMIAAGAVGAAVASTTVDFDKVNEKQR